MIIRLLIIGMCVGEIVLREFKDDRDEDEELVDDILVQVTVEGSDFGVVRLHDAVLANILVEVCRLRYIQLREGVNMLCV